MNKKRNRETQATLSRESVLDALAGNPHATKRDLARTLGVIGNDRIALKRILKELETEGAITRGRKRSFAKSGALPEVLVLEIRGRDHDGELLARPQRWEGDEEPPQIIVLPGREGDAPGDGDRILARISETRNGYEARIIKRLGASAHKVLGVFHHGEREGLIAPIDRKSRLEFVVDARDQNGAKPNELVLAEPLAGRAYGAPRARIVERLGSMDAPKAISLIAIHAHGIPTEFPADAIAQAERAQPAGPQGRTDLRHIPLVTIDPEDARDHDDAVWAGPDDDPRNAGGHVAIVAIADVGHYVTPGSALDRAAYERGNSVYFPDRVVPMLPERLSAGLCSLQQGEDRACLAVRMVFDRHGNKKHHEFLRGIMRSAARLSYHQAQRAFDGNPDDDCRAIAKETLVPLWAAYQAMAAARDKREPLNLDLPERRVIIGEDGKVKSIAYRERLESMRLIEEFMVQANVAAAETLEKARVPLIFRVHEHPSKEKLLAFSDFLRTVDIPFAKGQVVKPGTFNRILERAKNTTHTDVLNDVVLRTQAQAVYSPDNIGHFGLNLSHYAHFTSPIRRYADLIVHRALIRAFKFGDDGLSDSDIGRLRETADHISVCERRAMAAERDSTDRYVAAYMEARVGNSFDVRVTGVTRFGLFVRIPETGAEGLIPVRTLGTEFFRHDERRHALIGERSGTKYGLGDILHVRLVEAAPLTGGLRFDLAETAQDRRPRKTTPGKPVRQEKFRQKRGKAKR
ncbi:MAG: ribonuclease R [Alphaproteobacteria bacterium]|nr:ribonuclease R [Alphaproteobacteria bacterium]